MATKKLQILDSLIKQAENADTLDGKHADEFASALDMDDLKKKVGDSAVSEQINNAIDGLSTETYVDNKVASIVDSAPETLDTLNKLAAALGNDENFAVTVAEQIGELEDKVGDSVVSEQIGNAVEGLATETYVDEKVAGIVNSAPETLDTLNELSKALGDDPNFATTVATQIGQIEAKVGDTSVSEQIAAATITDTTLSVSSSAADAKATGDAIKAIPVKAGTGSNSAVLNTGDANGDYAFAGGTADKQLVTDIVGSVVDDYITITPSEANGSMSISYGAGNIAHSSASNAFGIKNQAGFKGYYIWDVNFETKVITLSTNQRTSRIAIIGTKRTAPNSSILSGWSVGDTISIINNTFYPACCAIAAVDATNGTITVDNLPFTELNWPTVWMPHDMSIIAVPPVGTKSYLGQTFETYRPNSVGEVEFGYSSTTFGFDNISAGTLSTTFGYRNTALGTTAFVTGRENTGGFASLVGGYQNTVTGGAGFAVGRNNKVTGEDGTAEGYMTEAGYRSHAEGRETNAQGTSHTEGFGTLANNVSHAEGHGTQATGENSHAEGKQTTASGHQSHTEGQFTEAVGPRAHAEGYKTTALGSNSHIEGGSSNKASDLVAMDATGDEIITAWDNGKFSLAHNEHTHTEGFNNLALGWISHAEGHSNLAQGGQSHAEGRNTKAKGNWSHTEGQGTIAGSDWQHVQGKFNIEDTNKEFAHIVGNGNSDTTRSNAHTVDWKGNAWFAGDVSVGKDNDVLATEKIVNEKVDSVKALISENANDIKESHNNFANAIKKTVSGENIVCENVSPVKHHIKCKISADLYKNNGVSGVWKFNETLDSLIEYSIGFTSAPSSIGNTSYNGFLIIKDCLTYSDIEIYTDNRYSMTDGWIGEGYRVIDFGNTVQTVSDEFWYWLSRNATPISATIICSDTPIDIIYYQEELTTPLDTNNSYRNLIELSTPLIGGKTYYISARNIKSANGQGCVVYEPNSNTTYKDNYLTDSVSRKGIKITIPSSIESTNQLYIYAGINYGDSNKSATMEDLLIEENGYSDIYKAEDDMVTNVLSYSPTTYITSMDNNVIIEAEYNVDATTQLTNLSDNILDATLTSVRGSENVPVVLKDISPLANSIKIEVGGLPQSVYYNSPENLWDKGDITVTNYNIAVDVSLSAGHYVIIADVESSDTNANTCLLYNNTTSESIGQFSRGKEQYIGFTLSTDTNKISFYSSNNYVNGKDDTATFKNIYLYKCIEYVFTSEDIDRGLAIDIKPIFPVTYVSSYYTFGVTYNKDLGAALDNIDSQILGTLRKSGKQTLSGTLTLNGGSLDITDPTNSGRRLAITRTIDSNNYKMMMTPFASDGSIYYYQGDTLVNALQLKPDETSLKKPLNIGSGGTGAITAANALKNLNGVSIETSSIQSVSANGSKTFTFAKNVIAAYVILLFGDTYMDSSLWTPAISGRSHWFYGNNSYGDPTSFETKVTISGKTVTVHRMGEMAFDYQVIAFTQ